MFKVFCIGAHKTGTTSLEHCLELLGFSPHAGWNQTALNGLVFSWLNEDYEHLRDFASGFQSFSDSPWNHTDFYKRLYDWFPDSKFILTVRDPKEWFQSYVKWATPPGRAKTQISSLPYGPEFHRVAYNNINDHFEGLEHRYTGIFQKRNQDIVSFFDDSNLLVMDLAKGDGWEELCKFLNVPTPPQPFPHLNSQS